MENPRERYTMNHRKRWTWTLTAPLLAAVLAHWPLALLDDALHTAGLFPSPVASTGLTSIAGAAALAIAWRWPDGWMRRLAALTLGAGLAAIMVWAMRYMVWHTWGADTPTQMAGEFGTTFTVSQWGISLAMGSVASALAGVRISKPAHLPLHALGLVAALGLSEGIVRVLGIDLQLMNKALYYQTVELEVHTPVEDPVLLYTLKPDAQHGGVGPWGIRDIRINAQGARSPDYPVEKTVDAQRVLFFGGSTLFGAGVGNKDTIPSALERILRKDHPTTEVWNFGACAYNTTQSARLAEIQLQALDPDLILMLVTNTGRRAFMGGPEHEGRDKTAYFDANPWLYLENFPTSTIDESTHWWLLRHLALYRSYAAWARVYVNPDTTMADQADRAQVASLESAAAAAGVPVVYVLSPSRGSEIGPEALGILPQRWIDLYVPGREGEYSEAHPSPIILAEYAQTISEALKDRGYVWPAEPTDP